MGSPDVPSKFGDLLGRGIAAGPVTTCDVIAGMENVRGRVDEGKAALARGCGCESERAQARCCGAGAEVAGLKRKAVRPKQGG